MVRRAIGPVPIGLPLRLRDVRPQAQRLAQFQRVGRMIALVRRGFFNHRVAAYLLGLAILWRAVALLRSGSHAAEFRSACYLALATVVQVGLGIWTLLSQVPLALAIAHQAMAASVFALAVWHLYESQYPRPVWQCAT